MAKQITQVGVLKTVLTGTELVEIQEGAGGFGSSKRTTVQAIATFVSALFPTIPVTSVQGRYGNVVLVKADVGLGNADNTSDLNKPISTATQTALNTKANISGQTFTGPVDATALSVVGVTVVTVGTFNTHFDARLAIVLNSTSQLPEGSNLYYTEDRVDARIEELRTNTDDLPEGLDNRYFTGQYLFDQIEVATGVYKVIDPDTGIVTLFGEGTPTEPAVVMVNTQQGIVELDTDDIPEGATNKYYQTPDNDGGYYEHDGAGWVERNVSTALTAVSGVVELDWEHGEYFTLALAGDTTVNLAALLKANRGATIALSITQGAAWVVTWDASIDWGVDIEVPEVPTTVGAVMDLIFTTFDSGATWIGSYRVRS